jgi:release factor glutamine methyltransferase
VKYREAWQKAAGLLEDSGLEEARLEAEILLRHTLGISRVQLHLELERELHPNKETAYFQTLKHRLEGVPSAYITGEKEFYGRTFQVDKRVLIPRPETEHLIEKALRIARNYESPYIADIGTGSGAIAITLALELKDAYVYATDISAEALEVARNNAAEYRLEKRLMFYRGDLLESLPEMVDILTANLPYVPTTEAKLLKGEPLLALDGGADGLDIYRRLIPVLPDKLRPGGTALLEIGIHQSEVLAKYIKEYLPQAAVEISPDYAGIPRVVGITLPS